MELALVHPPLHLTFSTQTHPKQGIYRYRAVEYQTNLYPPPSGKTWTASASPTPAHPLGWLFYAPPTLPNLVRTRKSQQDTPRSWPPKIDRRILHRTPEDTPRNRTATWPRPLRNKTRPDKAGTARSGCRMQACRCLQRNPVFVTSCGVMPVSFGSEGEASSGRDTSQLNILLPTSRRLWGGFMVCGGGLYRVKVPPPTN